MWEARDAERELWKEMDGGQVGSGTGLGERVTSVMGLTGSDMTISWYCSQSREDKEVKMGEKTGKRISGESRVTYVWKLWR